MMTALADSSNDDSLDAEFLEFLADVEESTGEGFYLWLEFDTEAEEDEEQNSRLNDTNN